MDYAAMFLSSSSC